MPTPDESLAELRRVFRDELEDSLPVIERAGLVLGHAGHDAAARREAVAELFRVVHSLKGAARAVAWPSIERLCHALETRLGGAREGGRDALAGTYADVALAALRACARSLDARGEPDEGALREAGRALSAQVERAPVAPPAVLIAPPPPPEARPSVEPAPAAPPDETVRLPQGRLHNLLAAAEDLAAAVGRHADVARLEEIERTLTDARETLRRAQATARAEGGSGDAFERVSQALGATLFLVSERRRHESVARRALASAVGEVLARSREVRVMPAGVLAPALESVAHDVARALGREVTFAMEGAAVEVDRRVIDGLREPLLHLVRNAVDHGVEPPDERAARGKDRAGEVRVTVEAAGGDVRVTVSDDGRGVDLARVLTLARARGMDAPDARDERAVLGLLFEPGFSTRESVTELSGRGVGLDVVRQRVARLHGHVAMTARPGAGARVTVTVPVDLTVTRAILARVRDVTVAFITTAEARVRRVTADDVRAVGGLRHVVEDGALVALAGLAETLGIPASAPASTDAPRPCVVVVAGERRAAFLVDELIEEREVVVRPLGRRVRRAAFVSGAAVTGDGEVVLVLDTGDLVGLARASTSVAAGERAARRRVLVVDDSVTTRQLVRTILEGAGYAVAVAPDGAAAWELLRGEARFDAVVSDIEMPRMDGYQLLGRVRADARTARLPVVLVTALARPTEQQRALELGASAYVIKSRFDQDELLHTLEQLIGP